MKTIVDQLKNLHFGKRADTVAPHKFALLLALADLFDSNSVQKNEFVITEDLEKLYLHEFQQLCPTYDMNLATIDHPFYHLKNDGFWFLHIKPGFHERFKEIESTQNMRFTKNRINETVQYGYFSDTFFEYLKEETSRIEIKKIIKEIYFQATNLINNVKQKAISLVTDKKGQCDYCGNSFIDYLDSLQRTNGSNKNALAEAQANNPHFHKIHVAHPLAQKVLDELMSPNGGHVILTGHAGDGKSTIALEVFKYLLGISPEKPLSTPMKIREDVQGFSIIKDLSERKKSEDGLLIEEIIKKKNRFLLVSNTGTLLELFKSQADRFALNPVEMEGDVLSAISNEQGRGNIHWGENRFLVFNLAKIDNLKIARSVLEKMIDPMQWEDCRSCPSQIACPVRMNVDLIRIHQDRVLERIFLVYRRMYEYGTRLTMRQLTEHLAYFITSGLNSYKLSQLIPQVGRLMPGTFLFCNRFFGDNGRIINEEAQQMQAIIEIRKQRFGTQPSPSWERKLWLNIHGSSMQLGIEELETDFGLLRVCGGSLRSNERMKCHPDHAREQVRRLLFFFFDFRGNDCSYLSQFLNSSSLLSWINWQKQRATLEPLEKNKLALQLFHVLQEHFTGVRLPEGADGYDQRLYVTLSRKRKDVRQSAQVVLVDIDWKDKTKLMLMTSQDVLGEERTDLVLKGVEQLEGTQLHLSLPFLDYMTQRHYGGLGEVLQLAYVQRLERFKADIQRKVHKKEDGVMFVRLKTDHTFKRQMYAVHKNRMEVSDDV